MIELFARRIRHAACVLAVVVGSRTVRAAGPTFTVDSPADVADATINGVCDTGGGVCTLRAAVQEANATTGATIQLPAFTVSLLSEISIGATTVSFVGQGTGSSVIAVVNGVQARMFSVAAGANVSFSGIRLTGGRGTNGGAISCAGNLTITSCLFDNNTTNGRGGAIYLTGGTTVVTDSLFTGNVAGPTATLGSLAYDGGAIWGGGAALDISRSTFSGNSAASLGGAISGGAPLGTPWKVRTSTFDQNTAVSGGAICFTGGKLELTNSTLNANKSWANGGGVYLYPTATAAFYNATLADNISGALNASYLQGTYPGAGIYNTNATAGSVQITDSLLAGNAESVYDSNTQQMNYFVSECYGGVLSTGYNWLLSNAYLGNNNRCSMSGTYQTGSITLGPLRDNGGPTKTRALPSGSPAIGAGDPLGCTDALGAFLTTDQRGSKRPVGTHCDLGAFEAAPRGDADGNGVVNVSDVLYLINYLFAGGPRPLGLADADSSGVVNVSDVLFLINYLFAGGPSPA